MPARSLAIAAEDINASERETLAIVFFIRVPRLLHSSLGNSGGILHESILTRLGPNDGTTPVFLIRADASADRSPAPQKGQAWDRSQAPNRSAGPNAPAAQVSNRSFTCQGGSCVGNQCRAGPHGELDDRVWSRNSCFVERRHFPGACDRHLSSREHGTEAFQPC